MLSSWLNFWIIWIRRLPKNHTLICIKDRSTTLGASPHLFLRVPMSLCKWCSPEYCYFLRPIRRAFFQRKFFVLIKKNDSANGEISLVFCAFYCSLFFSTSSRRLLKWLLGGRFIRWLSIAFSPHPAATFCGRLIWIFNVLFTCFPFMVFFFLS